MTNRDQRETRDVRKGGAPLVVFACLLILAVTAASFTLLGEEDDTTTEGTAAAATGTGEIRLEPLGHDHDGDFFTGLDLAGEDDAEPSLHEVADRVATLPPFGAATGDAPVALAGRQALGTEPGLYSGHRRTPVCGVNDLTELLTGDDSEGERASAWAEALSLGSVDEIAPFLGELTAARLRLDTRVTSYGYADGTALPQQALLQAGTGVLVDENGVPQVKCDAGNPLTAPAPLDEGVSADRALDINRMAVNPADAWDQLDPALAVTVAPGADQIDDLILADIDSTDLLERPAGTNGHQDMGPRDIEVTLTWEGPSDLDLRVVDPNEATISVESPGPENSRGRHSGDANEGCVENTIGREHISWPNGDAPAGEYTIVVRGFTIGEQFVPDCGPDEPVAFTLTIRLFGQETIIHTGSVEYEEESELTVTLGNVDPPGDSEPAEDDDDEGNDPEDQAAAD